MKIVILIMMVKIMNIINNKYIKLPMKNIHYIFTIFKNLILIGNKDLIEILIKDEYYLITVSGFE